MSGTDIFLAAYLLVSLVLAALVLVEARGEPWIARLITAALMGLLWAPGAILLIVLFGVDLVSGRIRRRR